MTRGDVFDLAKHSDSFATRMKGTVMSQALGEFITTSRPAKIVVNWDGVLAASPSFIDEFVGGLQRLLCNDHVYREIAFTCAAAPIASLLEDILERRGISAGALPSEVAGLRVALLPETPYT